MQVVAGIFGGLILATIAATLVNIVFVAMLVNIALAASPGYSTLAAPPWYWHLGTVAFFIFWVVGIAVAVLAESAPKAWRRLLLTSAVLSFLLPLAGVIHTGIFMAAFVDPAGPHAAAAAAGVAIGGGFASVALGFVGFFLGVVFLVVGLLVGRDKQIVYVQAPPAGETPVGPDKQRSNEWF